MQSCLLFPVLSSHFSRALSLLSYMRSSPVLTSTSARLSSGTYPGLSEPGPNQRNRPKKITIINPIFVDVGITISSFMYNIAQPFTCTLVLYPVGGFFNEKTPLVLEPCSAYRLSQR